MTAAGPGSSAAAVAFVGGSTAALVHSAELLANAAVATASNGAIVKRDGSGGFAMGVLQATGAKIGATGAPAATAVLELASTTQCFYPPRMTSAQRTAITATEGAMVYDTDLHRFYGWVDTGWVSLQGWGS